MIQFVSNEERYKSIELYDENKSNQKNIIRYAYEGTIYNTWIVKPKQNGFLRAYFALNPDKPDPLGKLMITQGLTVSLTSSQLTSLNDNQFVRINNNTSGLPQYEPYGKYDIPIIVRGKNLFNINDYRNKQNVSIVGNKITISNMNYVSVANPSILKFLKPNTKYTISAKQWSLDSGTTSNTTFRVAVYKGNDASKLHYFTYGGNATKATPSDISGYTHMAIYSTKDGVISIEDLQIEEASSKTEYEPYHEPITTHIYLNEPLRKIGDYADYIDFKNKKVVRNVVQGVLNGSESLGTEGTRYYYYNTKLNIKCLGTSVAGIKSNALPSKSWTEISNSGTGIATYIDNRIDIRTDSLWKNVAEAKEYMANNPIHYIAPCLEPVEEDIELPQILTQKGCNIITATTEVEPSNIQVKYIKK